ncbi:uncharacterized protein LOC105834630 [Monomorium pharaonis]|uniref:uncharacterized protein LOC105834630 n=1 Tax=Monomorium pharaonis TaxID=307658 RepID=UPI00063F0D07|nr:uncharacterized protein LOC105834630 [Monomorium pharaonis]
MNLLHVNMLRELFLIFTLICVTQCGRYLSHSTENLYAILDRTTEYFKNLSDVYDVLNSETLNNINNEIVKYMNDTTETILQESKRRKRGLQNEPHKGVYVLQDFEETFLDLPDFRDTAFFSIQDEYQLLWFAAAVNDSDILLYQLVNDKAHLVGTYPQPNGKRIIVNNYSVSTLIVVQKDTDGVIILRLDKDESGRYELQFKQEFEIPGMIHMNMWFGINQMYLGIASETRISIYVWLGENFDKIDTLNFGARKLFPFQCKSLMHIVVVGTYTRILRFSVRSNRFVEMQKLRRADDVTSFQFKEGHFEERFLVLAGNESTILYKEMYGRFVPFQRVAPARHVRSLTTGNTIILLSLEQNTVEIYQYNGWRFQGLPQKLTNVRQIHSIRSFGEDMLVTQNQAREWKFWKATWNLLHLMKTWKSILDETAAWCSNTKQKASRKISLPDLKKAVISNARIGHLRVQNINGYNAKELVRLTEQYKSMIAKLNLTKSLLAQRTENTDRSKHTILHGKKMTVKCKTNCHIHHVITDGGIKPTVNYVNSEPDEVLEFKEKLKVKTINNWKCPLPNFKIDDIFVKETINGILMRDLQERTLKVSGDQVISGEHVFTNLHATNVSIPLDIVTRSTKQTVYMEEAEVKDLHLTEGNFLLPLNGPATVMDGSITAAKVRLTGPVEITGRITGKIGEKIKPLKEILTPLTLFGDRFLRNVTFRNFIKAENIIRSSQSSGLSMKEILENSVPLDSNVPVRLILSSDKTEWTNVTLSDLPQNWVTKNSAETIVISGTKYTNNNVTLSSVTYENLPTPKLTIPICAAEVITPEIKTSSIDMGDIIVKNLNVSHILGARNLNTIVSNSASIFGSALHGVDFSTKRFTGPVFVKNLTTSKIKGINLTDLKNEMNKWIGPNHIRGPVNVAKLVVNNLVTPVRFNLSLPRRVKNVIIKGDSNIEKINNVNIQSFMENVLKVDDPISLEHVTFARGFTSDNVHTSSSTLKFSHLDTPLNLGSKLIATTLTADAIYVPQTFGYVASDAPSTFIIEGSAKFLKEPVVQNIKDVNLKQLSKDLWMANEEIVLSGSNMNFKNIMLENSIDIMNANNTLNIEMWREEKDKFLSKTEDQHIEVRAEFTNVVVPNIIAPNFNSTIQSSDLNLNNLLTNSLMRDTAQTIDAAWHFEELYINNMTWDGKFNGIDLNTDIVRRDAKQNIVTGKTTIFGLTTKNLSTLNINFSDFAKLAVTQKCHKPITIKGRKSFNNITLNNLSVKGTIMDRNVNDALLKSGNQTLFGIKRIRGHINAPALIIDGTVNDVNLTELINKQVKKRKAVQTIESKMDFRNDFEIFGNITIDKLYEKVDLANITGENKIDIMLNKMTEIVASTESITTALQNRAVYVSKFEVVSKDDKFVLQIASDTSEDVEYMNLNSTCLCESGNVSSFCNDTDFIVGKNTSFIMKKIILLDDTVFVVLVSTDLVSIYSLIDTEQLVHQVAGLYVPDILEVSIEPINQSLWIFLRLSEETLILRYHVWNEFTQFVLPGSDSFVISKTPNGQYLLIRSDGMWNFGGLFRPEHIFKMTLEGQIDTFAVGADYYVTMTTENSTTVLKARYVGYYT